VTDKFLRVRCGGAGAQGWAGSLGTDALMPRAPWMMIARGSRARASKNPGGIF